MLHKLCNAVCKVRITMKTSQHFWSAENPFSINNEPFSQGEIGLKFPNSQNSKFARNSWLKAPRRLLMSFLNFKYFSCFWIWNQCFLIPFFEKITKFLRGWDAFFVKNLPSIFPRGKSLLNLRFFLNFMKNLNCLYLLIKGFRKHFEGIFGFFVYFEFSRLKL